MKISGNTILITGGATGIGFALAEAFIRQGNEVIVCGRTDGNLALAKEKLPQLHTRRCDLSVEKEWENLYNWVSANFADTNVLVNNAGIQRMIDFRRGTSDLFRYRQIDGEDEIEINLRACVYLTAYFVPGFSRKEEAAIMNVSSGLGFIPMAMVPVYSATKAALHSFSVTLRHQLRNTHIKVFEIIPPTVDTNLDRGARKDRGQQDMGISPAEVAEAALASIEKDEYEIAVGKAQNLRSAARENFGQAFSNMNRSF
jgi:uncharacterized oxidoreductase